MVWGLSHDTKVQFTQPAIVQSFGKGQTGFLKTEPAVILEDEVLAEEEDHLEREIKEEAEVPIQSSPNTKQSESHTENIFSQDVALLASSAQNDFEVKDDVENASEPI